MLFRVGLAVFVSLALIGGAVWSQLPGAKNSAPTLVAVETKRDYTDIYWPEKIEDTTNDEASLTTTDLVSRQLMGDFMNLSINGQATQGSIENLAGRYAELIESLGGASAEEFMLSDLNVVPANQNTLASYRQSLDEAKESFWIDSEESADEIDESDEYEAAIVMSILYESMVNRLLELSVPQSVASAHLALVNNYSTLAAEMLLVSNSDSDPMLIIANLSSLSDNLDREERLWGNIDQILAKHDL